MERGDDRGAEEPVHDGPHRTAPHAVVIVDHVELASTGVRLEAMCDLQMRTVFDAVEGSALVNVAEVRLGKRVAAGEQRDLMATTHETLGEEADDELDTAVAARGKGEPGWGDHSDTHYSPPGGGLHASLSLPEAPIPHHHDEKDRLPLL